MHIGAYNWLQFPIVYPGVTWLPIISTKLRHFEASLQMSGNIWVYGCRNDLRFAFYCIQVSSEFCYSPQILTCSFLPPFVLKLWGHMRFVKEWQRARVRLINFSLFFFFYPFYLWPLIHANLTFCGRQAVIIYMM